MKALPQLRSEGKGILTENFFIYLNIQFDEFDEFHLVEKIQIFSRFHRLSNYVEI